MRGIRLNKLGCVIEVTAAAVGVAAVLWEKGTAYSAEPAKSKRMHLLEEVQRFGVSQHRFPNTEWGGPLIPFAPTLELGKVFALTPGFERKANYPTPLLATIPLQSYLRDAQGPGRPRRKFGWF